MAAIRKIDRQGIITTHSRPVGAPFALAVDGTGYVYYAQGASHRVTKVRPNGSLSPVAGTGTSGFSGDGGPALQATFSNAAGVAVDPAGPLYFPLFADSAAFTTRLVLFSDGTGKTSSGVIRFYSPSGEALSLLQ